MISRRVKVCVIIGILLQIIALLLINSNIATGYELGIYQNVPFVAWALLIISALISFYILYNVLSNGVGLAYFIFLILNIGVIFVALPLIRGYAFYNCYDPLTHIGIMKDIIATGSIANNDFYPAMHLWVVSMSVLGNVSPFVFEKSLPIFTFLLFYILLFVWIREIIPTNRTYIIVAAAVSAIFFLKSDYYTTLVPNGFSMILVPLILYLYLKKARPYNFLLYVCLFIIPFCHPLTAMILLIMFVVYILSKKLSYKITGVWEKFNINPILILSASFLLWAALYQQIFFGRLSYTYTLLTQGFNAPISRISDSFGKLNMGITDRIVWILKVYFPNIILGILAMIVSALIIIGLIKNVRLPQQKYILPVGLVFALLGLVLAIMVFVIDPGFEALRNFNFVFLLSIPLAAYILTATYSSVKNNKFILFVGVILLLGLPFVLSLFSLYESPYINYPGNDVTNAKIIGMDWFFQHKNNATPGSEVSAAAPWRFADLLYGVTERDPSIDTDYNNVKIFRDNISDDYNTENWIEAPDHFENLSGTIPGRYLLYDKMDYLTYTQVWQIRYTTSDFARLNYNTYISKFYTNGDLIIYVPAS